MFSPFLVGIFLANSRLRVTGPHSHPTYPNVNQASLRWWVFRVRRYVPQAGGHSPGSSGRPVSTGVLMPGTIRPASHCRCKSLDCVFTLPSAAVVGCVVSETSSCSGHGSSRGCQWSPRLI